ncbi:RING-H2 finger protein ATL66 [Sesamum alatum]|uniref:RING-type E3 ubiquitin transferase n=1 Tax=Sesamum alatum TaxID=300844 RepID=A0AAE1YUG4_9LAMI|nr:RING-H2 finger protein ATL66 [Sesamum alatum]
MSSEQVSSSPLRWHYSESETGNFEIRGRTLFFMVVLFSIILLVTLLFIYARWVCRFNHPPSPPPPATTSPSQLAGDQRPPSRSLDIATVNRMAVVLYKKSASSGGSRSEAECCICLEIFGDKEEVKVLPECRHCFHSECVDKWFTAESSCPLCRASLRVDSPV